MVPDRPADFRPLVVPLLVAVLLVGATACSRSGDSVRVPVDSTKTVAAPLTTGIDTRDSARAAYYAAQATKYRDIATHDRQLSAAYARVAAPATASKDWNAALKVRVDARAAAADQIAAQVQTLADFHTAQAAKAVGQ